jgi:hypothetical protein
MPSEIIQLNGSTRSYFRALAIKQQIAYSRRCKTSEKNTMAELIEARPIHMRRLTLSGFPH